MNVRNALLLVSLAVTSALVGGCASTTAPAGWLPTSAETRTRTTGGWVSIFRSAPDASVPVEGELIAVSADSVWVLNAEGLTTVPRERIRGLTVIGFAQEHGRIGSWTALGALSSLSHGIIAVFSIPVWVLVGSATGAAASWEPITEYVAGQRGLSERVQAERWNQLSRWARFPQGLPAGFDQSALGSTSQLLVPRPPRRRRR